MSVVRSSEVEAEGRGGSLPGHHSFTTERKAPVLREAEDKHLPLLGTGASHKTFQSRWQSLTKFSWTSRNEAHSKG